MIDFASITCDFAPILMGGNYSLSRRDGRSGRNALVATDLRVEGEVWYNYRVFVRMA